MMDTSAQKPSYDEWKYWVGVVTERLTKVIHVYNTPPYADTYMRDAERQSKVETLVTLLRRLHSLIENNASIGLLEESELAARDEKTIAEFRPFLREVLRRLPTISDDMQFLLKSPWFENCTGRTANEIFCGTEGRINEGIGSGRVEHGRLPEILSKMLEQEQIGETRPLRSLLPEVSQLARRAALVRRRTSSSLGSAGRVD